VEAFCQSHAYDRRLFRHDIAGSIAHAQMLCKVGLLTDAEGQKIEQSLCRIEQQIADGEMVFNNSLEDIHMHIEKALIEELGDVGRKLHTGRSRNDQVSTDIRLWCRDAIDELDHLLLELQRAWLARCERDAGVILPAYTHLQRAQPVLAAHYWLAYCEKFQRDRERLADARKRVNISPLGAAAVAGTSIPIDRHDTASRLGFDGVAANSIDISSDRDFVIELAFVLTMIAEHLSTWAEEWVLWSTVEYGFLSVNDQFCTGSSIMPQKINPDVLELTRGKTARVVGNLQALLVLVKGLPLAYNRDLQEDKERLFDSFDTVKACLELAQPLVATAELNRTAIESRLHEGYLDATTLMEYCIQQGIPQRTAHHLVGSLVREAMQRECTLAELPDASFDDTDAQLDARVKGVLGVQKAVNSFCSYGSTCPDEVRKQIQAWTHRLK
jgi:argininosuccinate lyase